MTLAIGSTLNNRYRIITVLAQGGMGAIYGAEDETLGLTVAVKENLFAQTDYSRQFRREATILASLRHPNLPRVTDHFIIEGQGQYLVMDYIDGEDLRLRLQRTGPVSESDVLSIGIAICDALSYLHHRQPPILHRDIKPGNVRIDNEGRVFLVDFGLAKMAETGQATTIGAQSLTPGYAPPEQYGQGTDPRSDIYSLAATLYAAMTDRIPEDGLARAMGNTHLTPLRVRNPRISDQTALVIERALAVDPDQRYQSAQEFKIALIAAHSLIRRRIEDCNDVRVAPPPREEAQPGGELVAESQVSLSIHEETPSPPINLVPLSELLPTEKKRPSWLVPSLAGIGLVFLLAFGSFFLNTLNAQSNVNLTPTWYTPAPTKTPSQPVLQTDTALPVVAPTLEPTLPPSETPTPASTASGGGTGQIVFASDRSGMPQVWVMDADGNNQRRVTDLADGACQPDWSPDHLRVVYVSPCLDRNDIYGGSSLYLMNIDGTGIIPLDTDPGGDFEPAWSPNGDQIAFTSIRDNNIPHIYIYDLEDDTAVSLSRPSSHDRHPGWSPDGSQIVFTSSRLGGYQIWTMDADGGNPQEFTSVNTGLAFMPSWSLDGKTIIYSLGEVSVLNARRVGDFTNRQFPVNEKIRPVYDAVFSSDGYWIAFESIPDGENLDIYIMSRTGTNLTRLTTNPSRDFDPDW